MKKLSLAMIVKNEERCLARCLSACRDLVDEMVVADTGSVDGTREIARSFGARVFDFRWEGDFSAARNYCLSKVTGDFILALDADEYLVEGTREDIREFMERGGRIGAVKIRSAFRDGGELGYSSALISRLFPRGIRYVGRIHEQLDSGFLRVPVPLTLEHDGYLKEGKGERNLAFLREQLLRTPEDPYYLYQTALTLHHLGEHGQAVPYFERFYGRVPGEAGYRAQGIVLYLYTLMELGEYERALRLTEKERDSLGDFPDYLFFCGCFFTKLVLSDTAKYISYLPEIEASYLSCLARGEKDEGVSGTGSFKAAHNLGAWYEVTGDVQKAARYYKIAAEYGWEPSVRRLEQLRIPACSGKNKE